MSTDGERLPSRPLRNWFLAWHIHTGDPPEVIARGFGLEEKIVAEFLAKRGPLMIEKSAALAICCALRMDPEELWPRANPWDGASSVDVDPTHSDLEVDLVEALGCLS